MRKNIIVVLALFFAMFMFFSVSSCDEKTSKTVLVEDTQKDESLAFEPISPPDGEKGTVELKSREIPGLEITEPVEIKPEEKAETLVFWMDDLEAAKKTASDENKDLLILFTGSDWCPGCIQMEREIFSKKEFRTGVTKNYVPVMFDFPRHKSLPEKTKAQNEEMTTIYGPPGFPTVYLAGPDGRAYTQVGYVRGGAGSYLRQLEMLDNVHKQFSESMTAAAGDGLSDVEKARLIEKAITTISPNLHKLFYRDELKQIVSLDKDNEAGLKEKYELTIRMWGVTDLFEGGKAAEAISAVDAVIEDLKLTGGVRQEILFFKSRLEFASQDKEAARKSLDAAMEAEPAGRMAGEIKKILEMNFKN